LSSVPMHFADEKEEVNVCINPSFRSK